MEHFKNIALCLVLVLVGCVKSIRPDPVTASLVANYPSAEFYACGQRFVGIGFCEIPAGTDVSSVAFAIQGYYRGRVRVVSEALPADVILSYNGSDPVKPGLTGIPLEDIVLQFIINPEYPGERGSGIPVFGAVGFLQIKVRYPGESWFSHITRTPLDTSPVLNVDTAGAENLFVISEACQVEEVIDVRGLDVYDLDLSGLVDVAVKGRCIFTIGVEGPGIQRFGSWLSWRYAKDYRPLAVPAVAVTDGKLSVVGEPGVSFISLDDKWIVDRVASFDFDEEKEHVLRLLTVKGRVIIGAWTPAERSWTWKR